MMLAALPHILFALLNAVPRLLELVEFTPEFVRSSQWLFVGFLVAMGVGSWVAWRRDWPSWSASWYGYLFFALAVIDPSLLLNRATWGTSERLLSTLIGEVGVPLLTLAILLALLRWRLQQGILAALPFLPLWWLLYLEFVPAFYTILVMSISFLLLALAAAMIVRRSNLGQMLGWVVGVAVLIGLGHVGAAHFLTEIPMRTGTVGAVLNDLLPGLLLGLTPIFGLLLLCRFETVSRLGGMNSRWGFRLVVAGLTVGLILWLTPPFLRADTAAKIWLILVIAATLVCLAGTMMVGRAVRRDAQYLGQFELYLLCCLLVFALPLLNLPQTTVTLMRMWQIAPLPLQFIGTGLGLTWLLAAAVWLLNQPTYSSPTVETG